MAYISNNDKMLQAVLMNERLMKIGNYTAAEISTIYAALDSVWLFKKYDEAFDYLKRNI